MEAQKDCTSCLRATIQDMVSLWVWVGPGRAWGGVAGDTAGATDSVGVHWDVCWEPRNATWSQPPKHRSIGAAPIACLDTGQPTCP